MLRNELGILDCKYEAHKRALNFLWHLLNETSFKKDIGELTGPGPYMRLINLANQMGVDSVKAQSLTKGEWRGTVDRAIRSKACAEKSDLAKSKGIPPPSEQFRPRSYIKLGGGAAKYGVQFRWKLYQKSYFEMMESSIGLPDDTHIASGDNMPCANCGHVHNQGSPHVEDLARCYRACDNKQARLKRKKALCAIAQEVHGRHFRKVPKWSLSLLQELEWKNQSRECTLNVLLATKTLMKEAQCNADVLKRVLRLKKVTLDTLQSLS